MLEPFFDKASRAASAGDEQKLEHLIHQIASSAQPDLVDGLLQAFRGGTKLQQYVAIRVLQHLGSPKNEPAIPELIYYVPCITDYIMRKEIELMALPVTSFLRSIWQSLSWRNNVLAAFEQWVQDGASRNDVKSRLQAMLERDVAEKAMVYMDEVGLKHINWDQLVEFLCTCFYRKRLRSSLPDIPPDHVWMTLTEQQNWGPLSLHPQQDKAIKETVPVPLFPLEQKLLALGGTRMIYRYEPDLKLLLERGEIFYGPIELVSGDPHQCHFNIARIWNEQREVFSVVTGYALSEDGLWRQHSWLIRGTSTRDPYHLIETTVSRSMYFGVLLTQEEAEAFYQRNIDR